MIGTRPISPRSWGMIRQGSAVNERGPETTDRTVVAGPDINTPSRSVRVQETILCLRPQEQDLKTQA